MNGHRPPPPAPSPMSSWPPPAPFPAEYRRGGLPPTRQLPSPELPDQPPAPIRPTAGSAAAPGPPPAAAFTGGAPAPQHPAPGPQGRFPAPGARPGAGYPPPGQFPPAGPRRTAGPHRAAAPFPPAGPHQSAAPRQAAAAHQAGAPHHAAAGAYPPPGRFPPPGPHPAAAPWAPGPGSHRPTGRSSGPRRRLPLLTVVLLLIGALAAAAWVGLVPGVQLRGATASGPGAPTPAAGPAAGSPIAAGQSEFCRLAREQADEVTNAQNGDIDIAGMLQRLRDRSSRMAEVAPAEIRGDVQTVHEASEEFLSGRSGGDLFKRMQSPELQNAGLRVAEYLRTSCGVEVPAGLPVGS